MSDRFAILPSGTASNWSSINTWSATSGGATGASVPTSADGVYVDDNSVGGAGASLVVDVTAYCKNMDWTGATNSPTMSIGALHIVVSGNITFITDMTITATSWGWYIDLAGNTTQTLTTAGRFTSKTIIQFNTASNLSLQDDLTCGQIAFSRGTITTNNHNVTLSSTGAGWGIQITGATAKTFNMGSSVITASVWNYSGSNLTLTANTSTINCSGDFSGGGITTYNIVNLTGDSTISGSNTFDELNLPVGTTQTITFTDGTTQTITNTLGLSGSVGHVHTLQGSDTAGWALVKTGDKFVLEYLSVSYSTVTDDKFYAVRSTDGGNNTNWLFDQLPLAGLSDGESSASGNVMLTMYLAGLSEGITSIEAALAAWRTNPTIKAAPHKGTRQPKAQRKYTLGKSQPKYSLGKVQEEHNLGD